MTSREILHYFLALAVVFASGASTFHAGTHVCGEAGCDRDSSLTNADLPNFSSLVSSHELNHHGHDHGVNIQDHARYSFHSECEQCLLSNLLALAQTIFHLLDLYPFIRDEWVSQGSMISLSYQTYLSRAPPLPA